MDFLDIKTDDVESYHATDYPENNGTIIYLKSGESITTEHPFEVVDAYFNL